MAFTPEMRKAAEAALTIGRLAVEHGVIFPMAFLYRPDSRNKLNVGGEWIAGEVQKFPPNIMRERDGKTSLALFLLESLFRAEPGSAIAFASDARTGRVPPEGLPDGRTPRSVSDLPPECVHETLIAFVNQVGERGDIAQQTYERRGKEIVWNEIVWGMQEEGLEAISRFTLDLSHGSLAKAIDDVFMFRALTAGDFVGGFNGKGAAN